MTFGQKQTDPTSPMHWRGDMQADYFYPNGVAGEKFFRHLMQMDNFLATRCPKCEKVLFPPRLYCEDCFTEITDNDWREVPAAGIVRLFTVATRNAHAEKMEQPKIVALIDIERTDGAMLGIIRSQDLNKEYCGAKVKAILRPKERREGTLKDILYWEVL